MKHILKKIIQHQLAKVGFELHRCTSKEKILNLIESIYPYKSQFDLIRMGPNWDGGYLVPDDLVGIEACFSPGVGVVSDFELDCLNHGMKIFLADKSINKPNLRIPEGEYNFQKKFIGCTNNEDFMTMDSWVKSSNLSVNSDLLLQMDIETSEYKTLINTSDSLMKRFRIMVIEFHDLDRLWEPLFFDFAETVFSKILETHICLHIHPNNYSVVDSRLGIDIPKVGEFTFIRKDRVEIKHFQTEFPHKLDFDNSKKKHIALPKNWYKNSLE